MGRVLNFKTPLYDDVSIDSVWLSEYGVYIAGTDGIRLSVLPSQSTNSTKIVGLVGEAYIGTNYDARTLQLPAYIKDIDTLDEFKKLLMFNKPKWFHFKNTGTKIKGIVRNEIIVRPHGREGTFDMELFCPDPYFYESNQTSKEFNNPTTILFFNDGNSESLPNYEITGKGTVHIGVNGIVMTLEFNTGAYETLVINTRNREVIKGTSENRLYSNVSYTFPKLSVGTNTISVTGDCTKLKITPNSRWI